ncbi:hypothetical protein H0H92_013480 [Tricholoma furcatifolium]|nr:hypothetical protein H0H92_006341 [Tricholoma furcatifolium]KAG6822543.1 hypothetical protein H0H92_013480 [Tricholoma furcatifolium]
MALSSSSSPERPSHEENSDHELDSMMRSPTSSPTSGPRHDYTGQTQSGSNSPLRDRTPSRGPIQGQLALSGNRNELVAARRLAVRAKLKPYQCDAVEEFAKDTIVGQQTKLYIALLVETSNKLDNILLVTPPFSVSKPLMDNIKSYSLAVLLAVAKAGCL